MVDKKIKGVLSLIGIVASILVILITGNATLLPILGSYVGMLMVSFVIYSSRVYQPDLVGLSKSNLFKSIVWAMILGGVFFITTKIAPQLSIGLPRISLSIGDTLYMVVVLFFAPVVESIFQASTYGIISSFSSKNSALIGQALIFSVAHVAAYITGFYNYPSLVQGMTAINANLASFIAVFIFAYIGMMFTLKFKINNLAFLIVFHFLVNLVIYTSDKTLTII